MLLYFLCTSKHPIANISFDSGWEGAVYEDVKGAYVHDWRIVRRRVARLVRLGTSVEQPKRPLLLNFINELEHLKSICQGNAPALKEYFLEEIFAQMYSNEFDWNSLKKEAFKALPTGVVLRGRAKEAAGVIDFEIEYTGQSYYDRKNIAKFINEKSKKCCEILSASRLGRARYDKGRGQIQIFFECVEIRSLADIKSVCRLFEKVSSELSLDN